MSAGAIRFTRESQDHQRARTHARTHDVHAEQLLVLIKDACAALPEGRELLTQPDRALTPYQLISMAVDEYYRLAEPAV